MKLCFIQLALALFQIDLGIKHEIEELPKEQLGRRRIKGLISVERFHNDGLPGSRWRGHMRAIICGSGAVTAACAAAFLRSLWKPGGTAEKTGWALLTGGALSNLYDRCRRGYVVDYIRFHSPWKRLNRLVFNLADFFIFLGAALIGIGGTDHSRG